MRIWLKENAHKIKLVLLVLMLMLASFYAGAIVAITHGCTDWRSAVWALYVFFE